MKCPVNCGNCGSSNVELKNAKGRKFMYGKWDDVEIKVDVELFTCLDCSDIILGPGDTVKLDDAIKASLSTFIPFEVAPRKVPPIRFQIVKNGQGYQVRFRKFFMWFWITEMTRKGREKVAFYLNTEDAMKAAEEFVELQIKIKEKKSKGMEVVYDSHEDCR